MATVSFVTDFADPRLDDYRNVRDRQLNEEGGKFVAESEMVVRKLLASSVTVASLLVTAPRLKALEEVLVGDFPVYVAPQELFDRVAGFNVHRGCLAVGLRPTAKLRDDARTIVALEDLVDVDNLGALVRNCAAFGVDAMLLSPRCADPFYRKAIRVSTGSVFFLPIVRASDWAGELLALKRRGLALLGAVLGDDAQPLDDFAAPERFVLLLGAEAPGLVAGTQRLCDARLTIPMAAGANSLNVATAGAVFLHQLTRARVKLSR